MVELFSDVLESYIQAQGQSSGRLAKLTGIPKQTISSWREGRVKRPRHVDHILNVAKALRLDITEVNRLLVVAGHATVQTLQEQAQTTNNDTLLEILSFWQEKRDAVQTYTPVLQQETPFQALSRINDFVGRTNEIELISADLKTGGTICILQGMGGVGKSTVANDLAYRLRSHFSDGILWATLDHPNRDNLSSDQHTMIILRDFAKAYGVDVKEDLDIESRSRTVRDLLSSKNTLMILDGAFGTEDVRHFLPPSTGMCSVLITTRNKKMLADRARTYDIKSFSHDDGLTLLEQIIGRFRIENERAGAIEIIDFVGGLPLALRVIGSAIVEADVITLKEYCALLQDERSRLEHLMDWEDASKNVRATFELSHSRLKPNQQALFNQLAVFVGRDFSADAVAALTQLPTIPAKIRLGQFQSLSLLEFGKANILNSTGDHQARYHFHPLLRAFAHEKLGEPDPSIKKRLADYYTRFVGEHGRKAYNKLDDDWENIQAAVLWSRKHGWDETVYQLTAGLTQSNLGIMGFLDARGYWREGVEWLDWCLDDASTVAQNELSSAHCHLIKGTFAFHLANSDSAKASLLRSHALVRKPKNEQEAICHAYACEMMSRVTAADGLEEMMEWSTKGIDALDQFDSEETNQLRGYLLVRQSTIWGRAGDMNAAYNSIQKGAALLPDYPTAARISANTNLGNIAFHRGDHDQVEAYWQAAIADAEQLGDARRTADIWQNLGILASQKGDFSQAILFYNKTIEQYSHIGDIEGECRAMSNLGQTLHRIGSLNQAEKTLRSAIIKSRKWKVDAQIYAYINHIRLQLDIGNLSTIHEEFKEIELLIKKQRLERWMGMLMSVKASFTLSNQKFTEAYQLIERALQNSMDNEEKGVALRTKGRIQVALKQFDHARDTYNESSATLENVNRIEHLRTQVAMLELIQKQNKGAHIKPDLDAIFNAFEEMGATRDATKVKMFLESLPVEI